MRRLPLAAAVLLGAALAAPSPAMGQQQIKLHPKMPVTVAEGAPIQARIKVKDMIASVTLLCIDFQFDTDLFDPGETLLVDLGPGLGAFGSTNVGDTPLSIRSICTAQPELLVAFLDGRESVEVAIESGSATITSATLSMEGG